MRADLRNKLQLQLYKRLVKVKRKRDPKKGTGKKPKGSGRRLYTDAIAKKGKEAIRRKEGKQMATSGTTAFNLDLSDIMEEAYDLCGLTMRSGYDYRNARRALDLIFLEWQNKGLNLWTITQDTQTLTAGTSTYAANTAALEIVDAFIRTDSGDTSKQFDQQLTRISRTEYNHQAKKLNKAKPTQFFADKGTSGINIVLWSTPIRLFMII